MTEVLSVFALGATFMVALFMSAHEHARQRAEWAKERSDLLSRLMARDLREYVTVTTPQASTAVQVVSDEDEARYASEHGMVSA